MAAELLNPYEELTEELAEVFKEMVFLVVEEYAPIRPWWEKSLTAEQQLWRWIYGPSNTPEDGTRMLVLPWIMKAARFLGAETTEEALKVIADIFTTQEAVDAIPPAVVAEIPTELLEIVQAAGPFDAATHIRKMERMVERRMPLVEALATADVPPLSVVPPPLPIEIAPGTSGWPLYGQAPVGYSAFGQAPTYSAFGPAA